MVPRGCPQNRTGGIYNDDPEPKTLQREIFGQNSFAICDLNLLSYLRQNIRTDTAKASNIYSLEGLIVLPCARKWCEYKPPQVVRDDEVTILWNFRINNYSDK